MRECFEGGGDSLAQKAGCTSSSVEVFDENAGAVRLYQRLGYQVIERGR